MKSNRDEFVQEGLEKRISGKKKYHPPQLEVYGDVRSRTRGGAPSTMSDSGSNQMSPN